MLAIHACLAPNQRAGRLVKRLAMPRYRFSIAFHFQLLRPGWQSGQTLIIGHNPIGHMAKIASMPNAKQSHDHRNIAGKGRCFKMVIHRMRAI